MISSGATLMIAFVLLSRMGRGEAIVVGGTATIALLNWIAVRGSRTDQIGG
jgi:hypothetical protein